MIYYINDFIKDEYNCTPAFVEAVGKLQSGDTLCLDGKRYDLRPEGALVKHYYISNNDGGDKPIAMPIIGKENITVDGGGAELVFHGEMLPVVVDSSKSIVLKGFSIDYEVPMYAQAEIVEASDDRTVLKFDGKQFCCRVDDSGYFCFYSNSPDWRWERHRRDHVLSMEFDREGKPAPYTRAFFPHPGGRDGSAFHSAMHREVELCELGENLIAMNGETDIKHTVGNTLVMTYNTREFPGVFTTDSSCLEYSDIVLHHTMSMGFITQNSENITFRRISAEPRRDLGRVLSVSCDATHFVNCRGKIELDSCVFEYMMDDACNIHGNYHIYESRESENTAILRFGHIQQYGVNTYRSGDMVHILDTKTMNTVGKGRVVSSEVVSSERMRLTLDCVLPENYTESEWIVENMSTAPEIHIHDCISGYNRPRGFLLSSGGKTLVERCKFHNISQGIQLSGEQSRWYESGAAMDVTIRNNDFTNSAYCAGVAIKSVPAIDAREYDPDIIYSGRVVIEGNHFEQGSKRILSVSNAKEVIFKNNTFRLNTDLPVHPPVGESGIFVTRCEETDIEPLREV